MLPYGCLSLCCLLSLLHICQFLTHSNLCGSYVLPSTLSIYCATLSAGTPSWWGMPNFNWNIISSGLGLPYLGLAIKNQLQDFAGILQDYQLLSKCGDATLYYRSANNNSRVNNPLLKTCVPVSNWHLIILKWHQKYKLDFRCFVYPK